MPKPVESVKFNDGTNENLFAIVIKDCGDTKLDLAVLTSAGVEIAKGIARREKADYGPEGGGRTWHS